MVAVAVLTAAWLSRKELDRFFAEGRMGSVRIVVRNTKAEKSKRRRKATEEAPPSVLIGTVTILAVAGGFAGAKLFHILENLGSFFQNPFGMIFSTGGFTFYGGLIVAALLIAWYVRQNGLSIPLFADAMAPGLILGYGIGRIGCHLAGDGDWGIPADLAAKPNWLPMWLWAETYPNNILNIDLTGQAVYPTSIYEFVAGVLLFAILWGVRKHPFKAGWLFSLYLLFNGIERFLIEQIRVNNTFDLIGRTLTQAEVIAFLLIAAGVFGLIRTTRKRPAVLKPSEPLSPQAA